MTKTKSTRKITGQNSLLELVHNRLSLLAVVATVTIVGTVAVYSSFASTVYSTTQWDNALAKVIHSDVTQSVTLPSGKILWDFGDTTQVNGVNTVHSNGYPHSAFVTQQPGTLSFTAVAGKYGFGWQQVPNWSDGTYFWMGTPVVENGMLYVMGQRIKGVNPFKILGSYMAVFNASTLAYQKIVQIPGGPDGSTGWEGVTKDANGWWLQGTHSVPCAYATDCKVGDAVYVPFGQLGTSSQWQPHYNNMPATLNLGNNIGLLNTGNGYDAFTKTGDAYGGTTIERLHAATMTGTWTVTGQWPAPSPSGTATYAVGVHPEQTSPSRQILVSYNVNGVNSAYHPQFLYLEK